jgi:hypothetical protein
MFFARTQKEHTWKSPGYQFTRRQREAWEALVHEAERVVAGVEEDMDEDMDEEIEEEVDEEVEQGSAEAGRTKGNQVLQLSSIQKASLRFCIALLDQRITRR